MPIKYYNFRGKTGILSLHQTAPLNYNYVKLVISLTQTQ